MQIAKQVIFQARLREDEPAVATSRGVVSYRVLVQAVQSAIDRLTKLDVSDGSMAMIDVTDPVHHLYLMLALALLGIPSASLGGNGSSLPDVGPKVGLVLTDADRGDAGSRQTVKIDATWFAPDTRSAINYDRLLSLPEVSKDAVIRYVFSSGTTGIRKCVAYTVERVSQMGGVSLLSSAGNQRLSCASINLMDYTTSPGSGNFYRVLGRGGLMCLPHNVAATADMIRLFQVEELRASVGQIRPLLEYLRGRSPLSSLRSVRLTGARLPLRMLAEIRGKLCPDVVFSYGSTEMGLISTGTGNVLEREEGCAGYILPGVIVEIVDENGQIKPVGQDGILRTKPQRHSNYVDGSGQAIDMLNEDGWFYPGDIARLSADGRLVVVGRSGDVINKGGVIIAPELVEDAFRNDPRIKDVAAFSMPSRQGIDELWLAVVAGEDFDVVAARNAAVPVLHERTPDRIVRVDDIPRNDNRKVQRFRLRERLMALRDA